MRETALTAANAQIQRIVDFLATIGLKLRAGTISESTFLPGILIRDGTIIFDESRLKYPGDLLHEAGHLAIVTPDKRSSMDALAGISAGEEMAAIAWSWAALRHLGIPPSDVFHPDGYNGSSDSLIRAFSDNVGPGVPYLAWIGLCSDPGAGPEAVSELPLFPTMTRWLRES